MKRILINATQPEELRVALVDGQQLYDLTIERTGKEQKKANIYKGKIIRIEPSLEAAFVDYGTKRHGFLSFKEISPEFFPASENQQNKLGIKDVLKEGQELLVQVEKEERGNKGAALTTFISLAGCYLVLMPNNSNAGGISRRIEGEERKELKAALESVDVPDGMSIIVRTAGVGKSKEELKWDLNILLQTWYAIADAEKTVNAPTLIHQESNIIIRAIRDHLRKDIGEILIDQQELYQKASKYIELLRPDAGKYVKYYNDNIPLFNRFQIESQIESAFLREVSLPSGGSIVIDHTEAVVTVDINSARATKGSDIEETALNTNLEAANEIARQLRLRDLGGLVVIDFIDMTPIRNQRTVENELREALKLDKARVQVGRISRFGLLEMSRQRLRSSLNESAQDTCKHCNGRGVVRSIKSIALAILRLIEDEALKDQTYAVNVQVSVEVATFLLNEKREIISTIEKRNKVRVLVVPNKYIHSHDYEVRRIKSDEIDESFDNTHSYNMVNKPKAEAEEYVIQKNPTIRQEPVVKAISPTPMHNRMAPGNSLLKRLWSSLFSSSSSSLQQNEQTKTKTPSTNSTGKRQPQHRNTRNSSRNRNKNYRSKSDNVQYNKQNATVSDQDKGHQPRKNDKRSRSSNNNQNTRRQNESTQTSAASAVSSPEDKSRIDSKSDINKQKRQAKPQRNQNNRRRRSNYDQDKKVNASNKNTEINAPRLDNKTSESQPQSAPPAVASKVEQPAKTSDIKVEVKTVEQKVIEPMTLQASTQSLEPNTKQPKVATSENIKQEALITAQQADKAIPQEVKPAQKPHSHYEKLRNMNKAATSVVEENSKS